MVDRVTIKESGVLHLIARGLSNAGIGGTMVITEDTTKTHVGHPWPSSICAIMPRPS